MKNIKLISLISIITAMSVFAPYFSFGQGFANPRDIEPPGVPTTFFSCTLQDSLTRCLLKVLDSVLRVALVLALIFAVIMIAWAGISYILFGQEENSRKKATSRLMYAVVGLVIAFMSWIVVLFVANFIQKGTNQI
jgi:hypothetical protein